MAQGCLIFNLFPEEKYVVNPRFCMSNESHLEKPHGKKKERKKSWLFTYLKCFPESKLVDAGTKRPIEDICKKRQITLSLHTFS